MTPGWTIQDENDLRLILWSIWRGERPPELCELDVARKYMGKNPSILERTEAAKALDAQIEEMKQRMAHRRSWNPDEIEEFILSREMQTGMYAVPALIPDDSTRQPGQDDETNKPEDDEDGVPEAFLE